MKEKLITAKTMKNLITVVFIAVLMVLCFGAGTRTMAATSGKVAINKTNFPDEVFREHVLNMIDDNMDQSLSETERNNVEKIQLFDEGVKSMKGVEYFTNLTDLNCASNELTSLDVSKNTKLKNLECQENKLTKLDVSKNTKLNYLECGKNGLTKLDVSKNSKLQTLYCSDNQLTKLDVSGNTELTDLHCSYNKLSKVDVSKNSKLKDLNYDQNKLTKLDVSKNPELQTLNCYGNKLTKLDVSKNTELSDLGCDRNKLTKLDVSKNPKLYELRCGYNKLSKLDVSKNTELVVLGCDGNKLTKLNLTKNVKLEDLYCSENQLTSLDLSKNKALGMEDWGYTVIIGKQKTTLAATRVNGKWQVNLGKVVGKANRNRVTLSGKSYKYKKGIVYLGKKLPESFKYKYRVDGGHDKMTVTVNVGTVKKVKFNANGGIKLSKKSKTFLSCNAIGKLPTVGKKGYEFKGWYTKKKGGVKVTSVSKVTKSRTLYAHWEKVKIKRVDKPDVQSTGKGRVSVKIGKVTGAKGYQILYGTSSKFKNAKKAVTTTGKATFTKLTSNKTYYFKVRAYKKDSLGRKLYGMYSKPVTVKVE